MKEPKISPEILAAGRHHRERGEILDILLPGFTQRGVWWGANLLDEGGDLFYDLRSLEGATVPLQRVMTKDTQGHLHLRTSFVLGAAPDNTPTTKVPTKKVPYKTIAGDLSAACPSSIYAPHLEFVGGTIYGSKQEVMSFPKLKKLESLSCFGVGNIDFPELQEAGEISLILSSCGNFPKLQKVHDQLRLHSLKTLVAPRITSVGEDLSITGVSQREVLQVVIKNLPTETLKKLGKSTEINISPIIEETLRKREVIEKVQKEGLELA